MLSFSSDFFMLKLDYRGKQHFSADVEGTDSFGFSPSLVNIPKIIPILEKH